MHFFKKGEGCVPAITLPLHESLSEQIAGKGENSDLWVIPRPSLYLWDPFADVCYVNAPH